MDKINEVQNDGTWLDNYHDCSGCCPIVVLIAPLKNMIGDRCPIIHWSNCVWLLSNYWKHSSIIGQLSSWFDDYLTVVQFLSDDSCPNNRKMKPSSASRQLSSCHSMRIDSRDMGKNSIRIFPTIHLVGGWPNHLEKWWSSSMGRNIPYMTWKKKPYV